jgi:hypothetical protein
MVIIGGGIVLYREVSVPAAAVVDPATILRAAQPVAGGTEPVALPAGPVLRNAAHDPNRVSVEFGYAVGGYPYAYSLSLAFSPDSDLGSMDIVPAGHPVPTREAFPAERRWSETRKAYLVAVSHEIPARTARAPSLCVRAVLGPSRAELDLGKASLCVMLHDHDGRCHPSTLACGLIR